MYTAQKKARISECRFTCLNIINILSYFLPLTHVWRADIRFAVCAMIARACRFIDGANTAKPRTRQIIRTFLLTILHLLSPPSLIAHRLLYKSLGTYNAFLYFLLIRSRGICAERRPSAFSNPHFHAVGGCSSSFSFHTNRIRLACGIVSPQNSRDSPVPTHSESYFARDSYFPATPIGHRVGIKFLISKAVNRKESCISTFFSISMH